MLFPLKSALITGATSGIGEAFSRALAARGTNLYLTGRNVEALERIRGELGGSVRVETLVADLSAVEGIDAVEAWAKAVAHLDLLVNNAGFGEQGAFLETSAETHAAMLRVHCDTIWRLCYAVLPGMKARKHGGIINVASVSAYIPLATDPLYTATKAYQRNLSLALNAEFQDFGVRVQALCPGLTHTDFHRRGGFEDAEEAPAFLWSSTSSVVEASLKALERNRPICIPNRWNYVLIFACRRPGFVKFFREQRMKKQAKKRESV